MDWQAVTDHRCLLGECPAWENEKHRIFWIDIFRGEIRYFYPLTGEAGVCKLNQEIGSIALMQQEKIIAALENDIAIVDIDSGEADIIPGTGFHLPGNRFNDGKCDPAGRFWVGTMSRSGKPFAGSLYVLENNLETRKVIPNVTCSNGMAWSPDQKTFYYIDSAERNIKAYDYDVHSGEITKPRIVINIPGTEGYPDGMTIDTEGMLWVALWGGWRVGRYDPSTGKQVDKVVLPVSQVTSCTFGGENLDEMYVTTAMEGLSQQELQQQPLAGCLFVIKQSLARGMSASRFIMEKAGYNAR